MIIETSKNASNNLFVGSLDARALISYFTDLRGSLFNDTHALDIYAGVAENISPELSVDDMSESLFPSYPLPLS